MTDRYNPKKYFFLLAGMFALFPPHLFSQEKLMLTLDEAISRAHTYSSSSISARHTFLSEYWNWRSYKADLLPSVSFISNPSLNRSIQAVTRPDGSDEYVWRDQLTVDGSLKINQNVPFTGGNIYVQSALQRIDLFSDNNHTYRSNPLEIGYSQNLFGYNGQKWQRKLQPLRYEEAKKSYIESMENVSRGATQRFFNLALAQTSWEIARDNYANADTLYRIGERRYERIGTITESDMLQLEINRLSAQTGMINARMEVDDCMFELRSYLGITDDVDIEVAPDENIPVFRVEEEQALDMALRNNSRMLLLQRQAIESESSVASARAQKGVQASLSMAFGLSQSGEDFKDAYRSPLQQQVVRVGFSIPIMDWGVGKGKVKVAESSRNRTKVEIEQSRTDFRQSVLKMVRQFNLQPDKITIAFKTNETARRNHEIKQKLFLSGKATMLELNSAISEKDNARRSYINSISEFWNLYYNLRALTGYDFRRGANITQDLNTLIQ